MKRLDELKWHEFFLTDVFSLNATKSSIDRCKLNGISGNIPYITRTDTNNGWDGLVGKQYDYQNDEGNVITIGLDTQSVFYQPIPFYTGQNIQILSSPKLNKYVACSIVPLLKIQLKKFNWGGNGATLGRLKRLRILSQNMMYILFIDILTHINGLQVTTNLRNVLNIMVGNKGQ